VPNTKRRHVKMDVLNQEDEKRVIGDDREEEE